MTRPGLHLKSPNLKTVDKEVKVYVSGRTPTPTRGFKRVVWILFFFFGSVDSDQTQKHPQAPVYLSLFSFVFRMAVHETGYRVKAGQTPHPSQSPGPGCILSQLLCATYKLCHLGQII